MGDIMRKQFRINEFILNKYIKFKMRFLPGKIKNEEYCDYLRRLGLQIGKGTYFFSPETITVDTQRPWLLEIGEYCKITKGVVILAHDYSRSVLRRYYGEVIGEAKKTIIGNNVFLGMNTIVLMGSVIGDNVIVGAGSVVHGKIPSNVVVAGNPATIICTLEEYLQKRKRAYKYEALECARMYNEYYGKLPTVEDMNAFFPLYFERDCEKLKDSGIQTNLSGDDEEDILLHFMESRPVYENYDSFLKDVLDQGSD